MGTWFNSANEIVWPVGLIPAKTLLSRVLGSKLKGATTSSLSRPSHAFLPNYFTVKEPIISIVVSFVNVAGKGDLELLLPVSLAL